jgi:methyltransferase family protein
MLSEFVARTLSGSDPPSEAPAAAGAILDAGAGAGANMKHLSDLFTDAHWTGVDLAGELVEIGRKHLDPTRFTMRQGNLLKLEQDFGPRRFDVCFSIMTLSWIEDYEAAVQQMLAVTRGWLFILNLFSETDVDAFIQVTGRRAGPHDGFKANYNVYSLPRFREFCRTLGAREIVAEPFEIDIDLPRPDHGGMGSWTERTADGRRLQLSGPLLMPWWFVAVRI